MTTPNEQPVSDTPRTDKAYQTWTRIYGAIAIANEANKHGKQLERELNQANEKLDFVLTSLEEGSLPHANNKLVDALAKNVELALQLEQANLYRAELEAVARAAFKHDEEYTPGAYYEEELEKNSELNKAVRNALEALKAKGWKA